MIYFHIMTIKEVFKIVCYCVHLSVCVCVRAHMYMYACI